MGERRRSRGRSRACASGRRSRPSGAGCWRRPARTRSAACSAPASAASRRAVRRGRGPTSGRRRSGRAPDGGSGPRSCGDRRLAELDEPVVQQVVGEHRRTLGGHAGQVVEHPDDVLDRAEVRRAPEDPDLRRHVVEVRPPRCRGRSGPAARRGSGRAGSPAAATRRRRTGDPPRAGRAASSSARARCGRPPARRGPCSRGRGRSAR